MEIRATDQDKREVELRLTPLPSLWQFCHSFSGSAAQCFIATQFLYMLIPGSDTHGNCVSRDTAQ